jgi:hypothetical protein
MKVTLEIDGKTFGREIEDDAPVNAVAAMVTRTLKEARDKQVKPIILNMKVSEMWSAWGGIVEAAERGADSYVDEDRDEIRRYIDTFAEAMKAANA